MLNKYTIYMLVILSLSFAFLQCTSKEEKKRKLLKVEIPEVNKKETAKIYHILTGLKEGTYYKIAESLSKMSFDNFNFLPVDTNGSIDNISEVGSKKPRENKEMGIIQSDTLVFMQEHMKKEFNNSKYFEIILPLFLEEVHIIVNKNSGIDSLADLKGKKVSLGLEKSGTLLTSTYLLANVGIDVTNKEHITADKSNPIEAIKKVNSGELDAMFFVSGYPVSFFKDLKENEYENLTLISSQIELMKTHEIEPYVKTVLKKGAYPWLDKDVPVYSTMALLIAQRGLEKEKVNKLCHKIISSLSKLGKDHSKWNQVNYYRIKKSSDLYGKYFNDGTLIYILEAEDSIEKRKKEKANKDYIIKRFLLSADNLFNENNDNFLPGDELFYKIELESSKQGEIQFDKTVKVYHNNQLIIFNSSDYTGDGQAGLISIDGQLTLPKESPVGQYEIEIYIDDLKHKKSIVKKTIFNIIEN